MARATINRLSDRRIRNLGPGKHPDGNGLYLRVEESRRTRPATAGDVVPLHRKAVAE